MQAQILTFIIPAMMVVFCAVFLAFWGREKAKRHILGFAFWAFAFSLAMLLPSQFPNLAKPHGALLFHWFVAAGMIGLIWGIAKRDGQVIRLGILIGLVLLTSPAFYFASKAGMHVSVLLVQDFCTAMLAAFALQLKLRIQPRNQADHWLLVVLALITVYAFVRPSIVAFVQSEISLTAPLGASFTAVNFVIAALLALMLALCLIAMLTIDQIDTLREEAKRDPLTGLPNRAAFEEMAEDLLANARDRRNKVSLLVGDIDHFKRVNDTWGHSAGDKVIAAFGSLIREKIRPFDVAGRVGGEEFCILIWNCSEHGAVSLGNRLRVAFSACDVAGVGSFERFTASFGVAEWQDGEGFAQTFDRADKALYVAKRTGRDRVEAASLCARKGASEVSGDLDDQRGDGPAKVGRGEVVPFSKLAAEKGKNKS